ncbi:MAG: LysR substrate-binding domain-containing protein [Roseovarius sp.]
MHFSRKTLPPLSTLLPFEAAARHQSITLAAQELGLTQAAISKQIKALETHLGTAVFERRNRAVHLNQDGARLHRVVQAALTDIAASCTAVQATQGESELVLRSQQCEAIYWLMPRLSGFYEQHPGINLRVSVSTTPLTHATERYHLALQTLRRDHAPAQLVHSAEDQIFPVCSPAYLATDTQLSPADISAHRLLHHQTDQQDWMTWADWFAQHTLPARDHHLDQMFDSYPMVMQAALAGHGIALGWHRTCEHLLATGALIRPCGEAAVLTCGLGIYAPDDQPLKRRTQALLDWLQAELA